MDFYVLFDVVTMNLKYSEKVPLHVLRWYILFTFRWL